MATAKLTLSDSVKFGGTIISSEKIANQQIVFLDPPDSRVLAITEMPEPKTKKELQSFCGMISSMSGWFPNIIFSTDSLRLGCAHGVKFQWTKNMQDEFDKVKLIFTDQIRLSPYDPSRELNILMDGANSAGIGFVLYQNLDDNDPGKNVTIVAANSSGLKDSQLSYSPVECELLALNLQQTPALIISMGPQ